MTSVLTNEYLYYVQDRPESDPYIRVSIRLVGNTVTYSVQVDTWWTPDRSSGGYYVSLDIGNAKLYLNGVEQTQSNFTTGFVYGVEQVLRTGPLAGTITGTTTTVRVVLNARGLDWYDGGPGLPGEPRSNSLNVAFDKTFTIRRPASFTQTVLTAAPSTDPWIVLLPSTTPASNLVHLKNTGSQDIHVWAPTQTIDGLTEGRRIPPKGGMSLFQTGTSAWFIASYFGGTVTNGTATGGTTPTSPIVLADITSGTKTVALPNPATFASSYLCICAYTTGTSTTNSLVIATNGYARETASSSYSWTTAAGPSIGLFLVSDGSKWNIMGIYRGTNTTFDSYSVAYQALTSTIGLSSGDRSVDVRPSIAPVAGSGVFQIWKTKDVYWTNGAVVGVPSPSLAVNSNYFRWYRNDNIDYSAYIVLNTKVGAGADTIFPLAQYPSDN